MLSSLIKHRGTLVIASVTFLQGCGGNFDLDIQPFPNSEETLTQPEKTEPLFSDLSWGQKLGQRGSRAKTREKLVQLEPKALHDLMERVSGGHHVGQIGTSNAVALISLDQTKSIELAIERVEAESSDRFHVTGHIDGDPNSRVTLMLENGSITGEVRPSRRAQDLASPTFLEIRPIGQGIHIFRALTDQDAKVDPFEPSRSNTSVAVIDMLVAYTPEARRYANGTDAIHAVIHKGIADANRALEESGANARVRLVGVYETEQSERSHPSRDLGSLLGKRDGLWDDVHGERERVKADQVTLVAAYRSGGVASGAAVINSKESSAFSIVRVAAIANHTLAHELGHNLGLDHPDGYRSSQGRFRTIMAYGSYERICRFSNPSLKYNGYLTGDHNHDEVSTINANAPRFAKFR